ncbi:pyridoxal-phosphate dependent enzyme [Balneatrix alpica]|uniref:L-serine ammonia-lyase n=1 Tax=Balneatrix alpica TaxID=75684 RepID=A0ABV5ZCU3_9GAMM|nr:pyridoxal-phosphate dependent enzyme [Balneatrix alpica]
MRLHLNTPLLAAPYLAREGQQVWLKMDALQPSGSFKTRGVGFACQAYQARGAKRLVSSSGGNAGLAVAYSGRRLGLPVVVVVPETTTSRAIELIRQQGAEVQIVGENWNAAHAHAMQLLDEHSAYIHPFDDPLLWQGHASLIEEVAEAGVQPDAVVLSVGGGGLLCGVVQGLQAQGWQVPIYAMETAGAASLALAAEQGPEASLAAINSIATSLGAKQVAAQAYRYLQDYPIHPRQVTDAQALAACQRFLDDQRVLVEPACGASLAALYQGLPELEDKRSVLVVVCGGAGVSLAQLAQWQQQVAAG